MKTLMILAVMEMASVLSRTVFVACAIFLLLAHVCCTYIRDLAHRVTSRLLRNTADQQNGGTNSGYFADPSRQSEEHQEHLYPSPRGPRYAVNMWHVCTWTDILL